MHRKHLEEAKAAGVADIIDLEIPDENELERDLLNLEKQQQKLIAELRQAYQDEVDAASGEKREAFDAEMEARVKEMNFINAPHVAEQLDDLQSVSTIFLLSQL